VLIIAGDGFSWKHLLIIPAIILILILLFLLSVILGIICTRFRDITQIVAVFLQLIYFFTPIFWMKKSLASKQAWITDFNPFFHIIELVRSPLLGKTPDVYHWIILLIYVVLAAIITFFFVRRFRNRVAYWL
jgi:lipopolysaccharide transport system permease protein